MTEMLTKYLLEKLKGRGDLKNLDKGGRIILKFISNKYSGRCGLVSFG
jgi:hypothetical protein